MTGGTRFQSVDAGGMHEPPALGLTSTMRLLQAADDDANQHFYFGVILQSFLSLLAIPLALWAWLQSRQERIYLWLFLVLSCALLRDVLLLVGNMTSAMPLGPNTLVLDVVLGPLQLPLWVMFWWHWFGLQGQRWIPRAAWLITVGQMLILLCLRLPNSDINLVPRSWLPWPSHWRSAWGVARDRRRSDGCRHCSSPHRTNRRIPSRPNRFPPRSFRTRWS